MDSLRGQPNPESRVRAEHIDRSNGVTDSKQKKAVLLTNLPTETYQLAKDLMAPIGD